MFEKSINVLRKKLLDLFLIYELFNPIKELLKVDEKSFKLDNN